MWSDDKRTEFLQRGGGSDRVFFQSTLDGLRTYLADLQPFLSEQARKEAEAWANKHGPNLPVWGDYGDVLPTILRSSFIVALMIEAEAYARSACADLMLVSAPKRALEKSNGSWVKRTERFMRQVEGLRLPQPQDWDHFETVWLIRNAIVHDSGKPKDEPDERARIRLFIEQAEPGAPPDVLEALAAEHDLILPVRVSAAVCEHALDIVDQFLNQLDEALREYFFRVGDTEGIVRPYDDDEPPAE